MKTILFILILCTAITANVPKAFVNQDIDWILNIPTSPVKISLSQQRNHLLFENTSGNEISEIRLGLVKIENGKYKIISFKSFVKLNGKLPKGQVQFSGIPNYTKEIDSAIEKKAQLAVISVRFSDGSGWRLNYSCHQNRRLPMNELYYGSELKEKHKV